MFATRVVRTTALVALLLAGGKLARTSLNAQETPADGTVPQALATALEERCRAEAESGDPPLGEAVLAGRVVDAATGDVLPHAMVWVRPVDGSFEALRAGPNGIFLMCGLPGGLGLEIQASGPMKLSELVRVELPERGVVLRDVQVSEMTLAVERASSFSTSSLSGDGTARLQGVVRSAETEEALAGARVTLLGLGLDAVTGEQGTFTIGGVPLGRHRVITEYLGMASDTISVNLTGDLFNLALFTLQTAPVAVPELHVEVERTFAHPRIQAFHDRMERGLGEFITQEDIGVVDVVWAFRRIPGVSVQQCVGRFLRQTGCYTLSIARGYGFSGRCGEPLVYLDGHLISGAGLPRGDAMSRLNAVLHRLEGIEVYRNPAAAPGRFRRLGDACGIVLAWTRPR